MIKKASIALLWLSWLISPVVLADNNLKLSSGQTVYVSIYSNVFSGPKEGPLDLSAILSVRNTDLHNSFTLLSATYFDTNGKKLMEYIPKPITLKPLESRHFTIKEKDKTGGIGANFIVKWESKKNISSPIVESIMLGVRYGQGISFICPGKVIVENSQ
ncbi:MAG: DUF3124 domain-containing protein [Candidatus Scalindua sp. AMX11]|nr:MAG: DUF3124 domain-containing protein [Candidatus Scalindua sp.]NOG83867.1 DUF3124 domain-containing protein [Planctomycetota bacterium]RZV83015.1 MAG: DUF3124 domain-containing protein [Candidatus Scalindua sp. SCAELEC01]TDE64520.1 MAG: DUF3124 domain-containing protein [Candidatus Scalindua sp. AMX11]GJQ58740.1 MAG: hypothetical protein SCALA701_15410 [Candidatus Scalindua sp.]